MLPPVQIRPIILYLLLVRDASPIFYKAIEEGIWITQVFYSKQKSLKKLENNLEIK